jgi:PncC family amidohydrolase
VNDLIPLAETIAARLKARRESIAIAESSTGGLISAALLALPGASAYFLGGAVAYTRQAKILLLGLDEAALTQFRPATEPHALLLARGAQARFATAWGLGETGATGPIGNATAIRLATLVLRSLAPSSGQLRSRPAAPSGSPTCMPLQLPPLSFWPTPYRSDCGRLSAIRSRSGEKRT